MSPKDPPEMTDRHSPATARIVPPKLRWEEIPKERCAVAEHKDFQLLVYILRVQNALNGECCPTGRSELAFLPLDPVTYKNDDQIKEMVRDATTKICTAGHAFSEKFLSLDADKSPFSLQGETSDDDLIDFFRKFFGLAVSKDPSPLDIDLQKKKSVIAVHLFYENWRFNAADPIAFHKTNNPKKHIKNIRLLHALPIGSCAELSEKDTKKLATILEDRTLRFEYWDPTAGGINHDFDIAFDVHQENQNNVKLVSPIIIDPKIRNG